MKYACIIFMTLFISNQAMSQANMTHDEVMAALGSHISSAEARNLIAKNKMLVRFNALTAEGNGVVFTLTENHYITRISFGMGFTGTMPYGFTSSDSYKKAKKKLKKIATPQGKTAFVQDLVQGDWKLSFLSKGGFYHMTYNRYGPFVAVNVPDTDGDGTPDYRDSCITTKGFDYLYGCPFVLKSWYLPKQIPDTAFNSGFMRIYRSFGKGFSNVRGDLVTTQGKKSYYTVTQGIPGFYNERIISRDENPEHNSYIGYMVKPDTVSSVTATFDLLDKFEYSQMREALGSFRTSTNKKGGGTRISMNTWYAPYNAVECGLYVNSIRDEETGKLVVVIMFGYLPEFY